jgi:hypothetical protein
VVVNTRPVDEARLSAYASEHAEVVLDDAEALEAEGIVVERLPLLSDGPHAQHDSGSLAEWLVRSLGERERATA